jgi:hypothetical protein
MYFKASSLVLLSTLSPNILDLCSTLRVTGYCHTHVNVFELNLMFGMGEEKAENSELKGNYNSTTLF